MAGRYHTSKRVRCLVRDFLKDYTVHIKERVNSDDKRYIDLDIDSDVNMYQQLLNEVLEVALFKKDTKVSKDVIDECVSIFNKLANKGVYKSIVRKYPDVVYKTCMVMFDEVREGVEINDL